MAQIEKKKKITYSLTPEAIEMVMELRAEEFSTGSGIVEKAIREYYKKAKEGERKK